MADGITSDFSELNQLAADLGVVAATAGPLIHTAVKITSLKVKKQSAQAVGKRKHFKAAAQAIDFEITTVFGQVIQSEIGYNKDKPAGPLGNLVEFGAPASSNSLVGSTDLLNALEANQDDFEKGLDIALRQAEAVAFKNSSFGNITKNVLSGGE